MWETYLSSFPEEERQGYNCNCCRSFIKHFGNVVVIEDNVVKTIWNLSYSDPKLSKVFKAMDKLVKASPVAEVYVNSFPKIGTPSNVQLLEDKTTTKWYHLFLKVPGRLILSRSSDVDAGMRGEFRSTKEVFKRSLDEITLDAVDIVLELIAQNSIYRGNEFQFMIETFKSYQALYKNLKPEVQDNYAWSRFTAAGSCAKIRNTAIGTLLVDISNGEDVEKSVMSFERIMAPANYKRPTAIITKRQVEDAEKYLAEHGMTDSLGRRLATEYDVSVSNVLFTNRDKKSVTSLLGDLKETIPVNPKTFNKVEEIPVKDFLEKVLPSATKLEVLFEQSHMPNLVSLIAPKDPKAPS
jgi:hypothetical protein